MANADLSRPGQAGWQDRLVELHVLADHGDADAADVAAAWLAVDDDARRCWDTVQRDCDRVRAGAHASNERDNGADR